ncbi:ionotropic receptor 21a isoform X2 [Culex quinquefasciatus]|uniref:ionotropic receptor 21a isoform X2 n=1 Tax=Culex quinquefasciatus TaxID=7176 RepID=UPI0018E3ACC8|nr:ionotropic receptor 21a isoform X2 [Culex quinquefasciatus]
MKSVLLISAFCFVWMELLLAWQQQSLDPYRQALVNYRSDAPKNKFYELSSEQYVPGTFDADSGVRQKRLSDPTFRGNPKTREQIWARNFAHILVNDRQSKSLVDLLIRVVTKYLHACIPIILFDSYVEQKEGLMMESLFRQFPLTYTCGKIGLNYTLENPEILATTASKCRSYIIFLSDALMTRHIIGPQLTDYVVVIPRSSQWKLQDFLSSKESRDILNLLVIGESYSDGKSANEEVPYVLYTHDLYIDGLGSNRPIVLTTWMNGKFSRTNVDLFPKKIRKGFSGHRFTVALAHQPPFVFKQLSTDAVGNIAIRWDGIEIRVLKTMGNYLNFTIDYKEPSKGYLGPGDAITDEVERRQADIGVAGAYVTIERNVNTEMAVSHSSDCSAFITLMSSSLPRYRAILGPFQWPVWLALTLIYLLAIFPLAFSDKLSLRHLIGNWSEIENMFWYVFGTFTNSLTFTGENSWSNTKKTSTRMLIGIYWMFTIIITSCYTGSIIAFVTMPVLPDTVDTVAELRRGFYRVGTLDRGGWERWFLNSSDASTAKLLKKLEFVSSLEEGIKNVTDAWLISYAFIGSKAELNYLVQSNYSDESHNKRYELHVSKECFSLFGVSFVLPQKSVYRDKFNNAILYMQEAGIIGLAVLISEWIGGCTNKCKELIEARKDRFRRSSTSSIPASSASSANQNSPRRRPTGKEYNLMYNGDSSSQALTPRAGFDDDSGSDISEGTRTRRTLSESLQDVGQNTLQELYDGPNRRHSTIVYIDGKMMSEEEAQRYAATKKSNRSHSSLGSVVEHEVTRLFKFLDDRKGSHEEHRPKHSRHHSRSIEVAAEVNRVVDDAEKQVVEKSFGEELLH